MNQIERKKQGHKTTKNKEGPGLYFIYISPFSVSLFSVSSLLSETQFILSKNLKEGLFELYFNESH